MDRVILHCDCNSFFASVETTLNPAYRDVPMAVCGNVEDRHGIVLAKNELAKAYGIKTTDTVYQAKKLCPGLVIAEPHYDEYLRYSARVNNIYADYTDMIEPFGIDESWLDVTASGRAFGTGYKIAEEIRRRVKEEIGITVSCGVSFNKVFAKLGSDYKKPDATTVISKENYKDIVYPLPAADLLFVGKKTTQALIALGIRTIGELANAPSELIVNRFGKPGEMMLKYARGEDDTPVAKSEEDTKSIGNGFTFKHDLVSRDEIKVGIMFLAEEIGRRLREKGLLCTTVSVSVKDEELRVSGRQRALSRSTDIGNDIANTALEIISEWWSQGKPIRTITLTALGLVRRENLGEQIDMFSDPDGELTREKKRKSEETVDKIRQKYGRGAIVRGSVLDNKIGIFDPKTHKK